MIHLVSLARFYASMQICVNLVKISIKIEYPLLRKIIKVDSHIDIKTRIIFCLITSSKNLNSMTANKFIYLNFSPDTASTSQILFLSKT